ncbi:MAG TPA: hypothetical protein PK992_06565 [Planctomycetaceae bacterium]|nr:hypothetical protein [Planctomycetaceae bacterium]
MATHIIFQCPACQKRALVTPEPPDAAVRCVECQWTRDEGSRDFTGEHLCRCRICGCQDLWRQKDFPPALGLSLVATAAVLSSIAWAFYYPAIAIGILMVAGLIDMVLYARMGDMLVCYRCGARHRKTTINEQHPKFDLETAERYRQQDLRQREAADSAR